MKLGAIDYLSKPADADEIHAALTRVPGDLAPPPENPDVGGSRAVGTHPARLRDVRAERVGDGAPAQHAPPYAAADSGQTRAALIRSRRLRIREAPRRQARQRSAGLAAARAIRSVNALRVAGASRCSGASRKTSAP